MFESRALVLSLVLSGACSALGCGSQPGTGEDPGSAAGAVETDHYRYGAEQLQASASTGPEGRRLLEGPDNARLAELLGKPSAGVVVDPNAEHSFWIYTNAAERDQAVAEIKAHLVLKPATLPNDALKAAPSAQEEPIGTSTQAIGAGCLYPQLTLFDGVNQTGQPCPVYGAQPDLRVLGFDNRPSSISFVSGIASLYENLSFTGHSITFVANLVVRLSTCGITQDFGQINSLSSYTMSTTFFFFHTSWDNQATSAIYTQTQF
jgi:hypothetical protein